MNRNSALELIRRHSRPLTPTPTEALPQGGPLTGIRAVLFDVYGTLLVSAAGEPVTDVETHRSPALQEALAAAGLSGTVESRAGVAAFQDAIARSHDSSRHAGVDHPEVDVVRIWSEAVQEVVGLEHGSVGTRRFDAHLLALVYELQTNPVWPMPGARTCLDTLRGRVLLGIVSNAQFYTPWTLEALLGASPEECGFDPSLCYYSYRFGHAKPGEFLFRRAASALADRGLRPDEVLVVGNDMKNDVLPAKRTGFRTALFAGSAESLRWRKNDRTTAGLEPDLVVTELESLPAAIGA